MLKMKLALAGLLMVALAASAQQSAPTDEHQHHSEVMQRGDQAMGFSHEKTTHHFRLFDDGGAIEALANDSKDTVNRDAIRMHLSHIAKMFAAGDFNVPMFIHATNPPGTAEMANIRDQIRYEYQETESGARVRIHTSNPKALAAVHEFLRFQISDHATGDSTSVTEGHLKK